MEEKLLCKDSDNELLKNLSTALVDAGFEDAKYYYDKNYHCPYLKISKPFKKENDNDPETHYIFIDVNMNEYTVMFNIHHEHISSVEETVELVKKIYNGEVVDVALVHYGKVASTFALNTGDPKKNIEVLSKNLSIYESYFSSEALGMFHMHYNSSFTFPYVLKIERTDRFNLGNFNSYFSSDVFAEHVEYYINK